MQLPEVVNKRHLTDGKLPAGARYIGRPSRWGNPFKLGRDGNRDEVMAKYAAWLEDKLTEETFRKELRKLSQATALATLLSQTCPDPAIGCTKDAEAERLKKF